MVNRTQATDIAIRHVLPELIRLSGARITGALTDAWIETQLPALVDAIMAAGLDRTTAPAKTETLKPTLYDVLAEPFNPPHLGLHT